MQGLPIVDYELIETPEAWQEALLELRHHPLLVVDTETEGKDNRIYHEAKGRLRAKLKQYPTPTVNKHATREFYDYSYNATTDKITRRRLSASQLLKPYKLFYKGKEDRALQRIKRLEQLAASGSQGLQFYNNHLALIQIGFPLAEGHYKAFIIRPHAIQIHEQLEELLNSCQTLIFHSTTFDYRQLAYHMGVWLTCDNLWDTKLAESVLRNGKESPRNSMDAIVKRRYGIELDKDKAVRVGHWLGPLDQRALDYSAYDVYWPYAIYNDQLKEADADDLSIIKFESRLARATGDMELRGIGIDMDQVDHLLATYPMEVEARAEHARRHLGVDNLDSPKQIVDALHRAGFTDITSTSEKAVRQMPEEAKAHLEPLFAYREANTVLTRYIRPYKDLSVQLWDGSWRIYANFNQLDTETGRYSSSGPNLQNIPKTKEFRAIIKARPGYKLIDADYSSIEPRVIAHLTNDFYMVKAFKENRDIYKMLGAMIYRVDEDSVDKPMRQAMKAIVLGIMYGKTSYGLAKDLGVTEKAAAQMLRKVMSILVNVKAFSQQLLATAAQRGYTLTECGRKRYIKLDDEDPKVRNHARNQALNTPIQGTAAEIMKRAIMEVEDLVATIHDQLVLEVPEDSAQEAAEQLERIMVNAGRSIVTRVPIQIGEGPEYKASIVTNLGEELAA